MAWLRGKKGKRIVCKRRQKRKWLELLKITASKQMWGSVSLELE